MLWVPTASALMLNVAIPVLPSGAVPNCVAPSMKVTLPTGVLFGLATVAVSVMLFCDSTAGALVCTVVVVASEPTVSVPLVSAML